MKSIHYYLTTLAFAVTIFCHVFAQSPILLKDIRTGSNSSSPYGLTVIGNNLFFAANNGFNGTELYKTDGTTAGTILVKDINPTAGTSSSCQYFVNLNGLLVFVADNGSNGFEIWKSDGTNAGTSMVTDINPGSNDANPVNLTVVGNYVYFVANDGTNGIELWKTDGTAAGTSMVKDIWAGSGNGSPAYLTNVNGTLFFQANDGFNGIELWKSDGTNAGTTIVKDIYLGFNSSNPNALANINGTLYFSAETANNGAEVWKSNGTSSGTVLVKDVNPGTGSSSPSGFTLAGNNVFFAAYTPNTGFELWASDGTNAGTNLIKDINSGSGSSSLTSPCVANGQIYFSANDGAFGNELWTSNGTTTGTYMLSDINPGANGSNPVGIIQFNGVLYFRATTAVNGSEMFKSDGTAAGTSMIADMALGSINSDAGGFVPMNGTIYFPANDNTVGRELFKYTPAACVPPNPNLTVLDATSCAGIGNTANIVIQNSEANTYYQPFMGATPVGASIAGAAGQNISLSLLSNSIVFGTNNIIIKIAKNGCPASQLNDTAVVTITGTQDQNVGVTGALVCNGNGAYVHLSASQSGVTYQAKINGTLVGSAVTSMGGDTALFIPAANLSVGTNEIYVNASGIQGCPDLELLDSAIVIVSSIPNNATAIGGIICGSGSITLTASGALNNQQYIWYTSATGNTAINGATAATYTTPTLSSTTTYYVSLVKLNGCESATRTAVTASVSPLPSNTPNATAASNLNVCGSGATTIYLSGAGNNETYKWYSASSGGTAITGASGNTYSTPNLTNSTSYYPCLVNSDGCEGLRNTITVTVETLPAAPTTSNGSVCGSGQATLQATGTLPNYTFQWYTSANGNTAISGATSASYTTPAISSNTNYYVTLISINGCESANRAMASATILALPNNATAISNARCGDGSLTIQASGAPFGNTYQWYTSASGNTAISNATTSNYTTPVINATTTYYVVIVSTDNCESANRTAVIATINAIPADASVTNGSRCGSGTVQLSANGGQTYAWYNNATGGTAIAGANGANYTTPSLTSTTNFYVTIVGTGNCESANRIPVTATIDYIPAPPTSVTSTSVCGGGTVNMTASSLQSGESYQWFTSATGGNAITGTNTANYSTSITSTSTYYVGSITSAGCKSGSRTAVTALVNALPNQPSTSNDSVCGSGSIILQASGASSNGTYQWYTSANGNTAINGANNATYTTPVLLSSTNYYVTIINAEGCESSNRTLATAIVNNIPTSPTTIAAAICGNGSLTLGASGAAVNQSYIWYTASTGNTAINGATNASYTTPIISNTTSYYVSILSQDACESANRTLVIATVHPLPVMPTVTSVSRCGAGTVSIQAAGSNTYAWYTSSTTTTPIAGVTGNNYNTPFLSQTTNYYVTGISAEGCESATRAISTVTIHTLPATPTITAGGPITFCQGDSVSLTANTNVSVQSWSTGDINAQIFVHQTGNYTVTVVDANFCTSVSAPISILVNPKPATPIASAQGNTNICDGQTVSLSTNNSSSYLWSNGSSTQTNIVNSSGVYSVQVTNQFGCVSSSSNAIAVTVNANPSTPVISSASTTICANNPITLNAPIGFASYLWNNLQNTASISTSTAGSYTVTVTDANGCVSQPSVALVVTVIPSPSSPTITAASTAICNGDSITLFASSGFASYLWSTGETTSNITVSNQGSYTVTGYFCNGSNNLSSNIYALTVYNVTAASISGNNAYCPGSSSQLSANNATSYVWTTPNSNSLTTQSIAANTPGIYQLTTTDANGCNSSTSQNISEYVVNTPIINVNAPSILCPGTIVNASASAASLYSWSNGANTQGISITSTGCYTVITTDVNGCTASSLPYCINYLPGVPTPVIMSTDSTLCAGETSFVSCSTCPASGVNYLWSNNSNATSFTLSNAACLSLTISDINGCSATSNNPYCIASLPTPATPNISFDNNSGTLTASTVSDSYVWYLNGGITALSSQTITPTNNGDYSVIATSNNGCISDTSTSYTYLFTGITTQDVLGGFNLYPNPATDIVNIDIANSSEVMVKIYDMAGKDVYVRQFSNQSGNINERLNLSNLSVGVYHMKVSYNGKVKALKLVKAN